MSAFDAVDGSHHRAAAGGERGRGVASGGDKRLDDCHFLGLQTEIEDIEIFAHVLGVGGPGKGHHADIDGEPKNDLADGATVAFGHSNQFAVGRHLTICREQRETLIDHSVGGTELADTAVPTPGGVTSVLNEAGPNPRLLAKTLELFEGHVADAEQARPTARVNSFHGAPGRPVVRTQTRPTRGAVKHIGVDDVGS